MSEHASDMTIEQLEELLAVAPFHRWLGLTVKTFAPGQLELEMPWRDEIVGNTQIGAAHGGVLATLIDLAGVYALLAAGYKVKATADMRVDYHRPATKGPLVASSKIIKAGRQISIADTQILGPDGKLFASGRGAYSC